MFNICNNLVLVYNTIKKIQCAFDTINTDLIHVFVHIDTTITILKLATKCTCTKRFRNIGSKCVQEIPKLHGQKGE